jgi:hypothetical protein
MMFNLLVVRRSFRRPFRITLTVNEHDNAWVGRIDGDCEQGQQLGLDESPAIYQTHVIIFYNRYEIQEFNCTNGMSVNS